MTNQSHKPKKRSLKVNKLENLSIVVNVKRYMLINVHIFYLEHIFPKPELSMGQTALFCGF